MRDEVAVFPIAAGRVGHRHIADGQGERAAVRHGVAGIDGNIDDRKLQFGKVDFDRPHRRIDLFVVDDVAAQRAFDHRPHVPDAGIQIDDRRAEMLAAGKRQQLTGQAFAALGRRLDRLDGPRQFRIEQPLEGLGVAADDHQQIVEVVGDAAGQFADRLHFLRHGELFARLDQLLLGIAPLGGVAQHIGQPDQIAVVVVDRP